MNFCQGRSRDVKCHEFEDTQNQVQSECAFRELGVILLKKRFKVLGYLQMTDFSVPYGSIFLNVHIVNFLLSELAI